VLGKSGPEVRLQTLFRDHFVCAVREGHPLLGRGEVTPERYAACGHVVASRRGSREWSRRTKHWRPLVIIAHGRRRSTTASDAALAVASVSDLVALVTSSFFSATQGHQAQSGLAVLRNFPLPRSHRGDHGLTNVAPATRRRSGSSLAPRLDAGNLP